MLTEDPLTVALVVAEVGLGPEVSAALAGGGQMLVEALQALLQVDVGVVLDELGVLAAAVEEVEDTHLLALAGVDARGGGAVAVVGGHPGGVVDGEALDGGGVHRQIAMLEGQVVDVTHHAVGVDREVTRRTDVGLVLGGQLVARSIQNGHAARVVVVGDRAKECPVQVQLNDRGLVLDRELAHRGDLVGLDGGGQTAFGLGDRDGLGAVEGKPDAAVLGIRSGAGQAHADGHLTSRDIGVQGHLTAVEAVIVPQEEGRAEGEGLALLAGQGLSVEDHVGTQGRGGQHLVGGVIGDLGGGEIVGIGLLARRDPVVGTVIGGDLHGVQGGTARHRREREGRDQHRQKQSQRRPFP